MREEQEQLLQQRLLEAMSRLGEEREQRSEALRIERGRLQQLAEELQGVRKQSQVGLERLTQRLSGLEALGEELTSGEKELRKGLQEATAQRLSGEKELCAVRERLEQQAQDMEANRDGERDQRIKALQQQERRSDS